MSTEIKSSFKNTDHRIYKFAETSPTPSSVTESLDGTIIEREIVVEKEKVHWDWKARIREGVSATTSLSGTNYFSTWGQDGFMQSLYERHHIANPDVPGRSFYRLRGNFFGIADPLNDPQWTDHVIEADNQALVRLNNSISSAYRDLQGAVALGELGESLRMIRNPAKSLRKGFDDYLGSVNKRFKGRNRPPRTQARRVLSETWLEYSFGWKPLISDIDDGAKALANAIHFHVDRKRVFGSGTSEWTAIFPSFSADVNHGNIHLRRRGYVRRFNVTVKYHGMARVKVPGAIDQFDLSRFGLGIEQFIPTIWELIPYSFVVDYFTNIGDIINAYSNSLSADLGWLERGQGLFHSVEWQRVYPEFDPLESNEVLLYQSFVPGTKGVLQKAQVSRQNYTGGNLIPSIALRIPGMSLKWINLSALSFASRRTQRIVSRTG